MRHVMSKNIRCCTAILMLIWGIILGAKEYEKLGPYQHVEVMAVTPDGVQILHDDGVTMLSESDLESPDFSELRNYMEQENKVQDALASAKKEEDPQKRLEILSSVKECKDAPGYSEVQSKIVQLEELALIPPEEKALREDEEFLDSLPPEQRKELVTLNAAVVYYAGQLRIKEDDLKRALHREHNSFEICQRKKEAGTHKYVCTCDTPTWEVYQATKAACCKAHIAAIIQRHDIEKDIAELKSKLAEVCAKVRMIHPNAKLPDIEENSN